MNESGVGIDIGQSGGYLIFSGKGYLLEKKQRCAMMGAGEECSYRWFQTKRSFLCPGERTRPGFRRNFAVFCRGSTHRKKFIPSSSGQSIPQYYCKNPTAIYCPSMISSIFILLSPAWEEPRLSPMSRTIKMRFLPSLTFVLLSVLLIAYAFVLIL